MAASFAWFEKWGGKKCWDWSTPAIFGAVGVGESEIFGLPGAQGGRGKDQLPPRFAMTETKHVGLGGRRRTRCTNSAWPPH
jgi:hypothetical protein